MTLDTVIMLFGAFVALLPFLQLPQDWTAFFTTIAGIVVIGLGIIVRRRVAHQPPRSSARTPYPEVKETESRGPSDVQ
ncbi:MAG TPA: hypothetical protein VMU25_03750 [Candidatus Paceibacterota bacterium]|nr:hypothetical protein [Candidatus Paceibacterota bacterium]